MTETEHTSEPWTEPYPGEIKAGDRVVMTIRHHDVTDDEAAANMALVLAAPGLLAACEMFERACVVSSDKTDRGNPLRGMALRDEAVRLTRIAKAKRGAT